MGLIVPEAMDGIVRRVGSSTEPFDEGDLSSELSKATPARETSELDHFRGAVAENIAWHFMRSSGGKGEPWRLYWVPVASGILGDGSTPFYSPDVSDLDEEILVHWINRSTTTIHPAVRARYADLSWELGRYLRRSPKSRPECSAAQISVDIPVSLAQTAIDGYLDAVERGLVGDEFHGWAFAERAISLSVALSDSDRIQHAKAVLFNHHGRLVQTGTRFMWWRLHDVLMQYQKAMPLDAQEQETLVRALEKALADSSDIADTVGFDPHKAMDSADRLIRHLKDADDVKRVIRLAGEAFEKAAEKASGLLAVGWLEDLIPRYRQAGLVDDAARVERLIRTRSDEARSGMQHHSVPLEITEEEMRKWADGVAGSSMHDAFGRIAYFCMMKEDAIKKGVYDMQTHAPLASRIDITIMSQDGFTEATVRSVDEDIQGRALQQAADRFNWEGPFLYQAFERTREKHGLDVQELLAYIQESAFFHPRREFLLRAGLTAWQDNDPVKAIHLLVPQVEAACRDLLAQVGLAVRKPNPHVGGSQVLSFGDILSKQPFNFGAMKDVGFHLKALYTDPRGINLRNKVAHGLAHEGILGMGVANWVVHSILMIASLRAKLKSVDAAGDV